MSVPGRLVEVALEALEGAGELPGILSELVGGAQGLDAISEAGMGFDRGSVLVEGCDGFLGGFAGYAVDVARLVVVGTEEGCLPAFEGVLDVLVFRVMMLSWITYKCELGVEWVLVLCANDLVQVISSRVLRGYPLVALKDCDVGVAGFNEVQSCRKAPGAAAYDSNGRGFVRVGQRHCDGLLKLMR